MERGQLQDLRVATMSALLEIDGLDDMAAGVARAFGDILGWDMVVIWEADGDSFVARTVWTSPRAHATRVAPRERVPRGEGGRALAYASERAHREDGADSATMWLPMLTRPGHMVGIVELTAQAAPLPPPAPLDELVGLCEIAGRCFERRRSRDRIEHTLNMTQAQLARLHTTDLIGFAISTTDGRVLQSNDGFLRMIQRPRAELDAGTLRWDELTAPESLAADRRAIEQLTAHGIAQPYEKSYLRPDGSRLTVMLGAALIAVDPMTTIVFIVDISAQKQVERKLEMFNAELEQRVDSRQRELRGLAEHLHHVREEQLAELSREMHDVFGQELTVLGVDVAWIGRRLDDLGREIPEMMRDRLAAMAKRIDGLHAVVRRLATELRPPVLDDVGLEAAIEAHAHDLTTRSGLAVRLVMPDALTIEHDLATALYRIYQELVTNVVRHAQARNVEVTIRVSGSQLELAIADDGVGIAPDATRGRSLGLLGVRERAMAFGGELSIGPRSGGGTLATVVVPRARLGAAA